MVRLWDWVPTTNVNKSPYDLTFLWWTRKGFSNCVFFVENSVTLSRVYFAIFCSSTCEKSNTTLRYIKNPAGYLLSCLMTRTVWHLYIYPATSVITERAKCICHYVKYIWACYFQDVSDIIKISCIHDPSRHVVPIALKKKRFCFNSDVGACNTFLWWISFPTFVGNINFYINIHNIFFHGERVIRN